MLFEIYHPPDMSLAALLNEIKLLEMCRVKKEDIVIEFDIDVDLKERQEGWTALDWGLYRGYIEIRAYGTRQYTLTFGMTEKGKEWWRSRQRD